MGVTGSQPSSCIPCGGNIGCLGINEDDEVRLSRGIDRGLRETRRNLANSPKILLLGSGESGKSTIIKQMRILNNVPFTEYEREVYRVQVFYNLVGGMRALLEAMRELPPFDEPPPTTDPSPPEPGTSSSAPGPSTGPLNSANPGPSNDGVLEGAAGAVKRPRPEFLLYPPKADSDGGDDGQEEEGEGEGGAHIIIQPLASPDLGSGVDEGEGEGEIEEGHSIGRRELDGASTLNTNPNRSHDAHDAHYSGNSPRTPPVPLRPSSLVTTNNNMSPSSFLHTAAPSSTAAAAAAGAGAAASSSSSNPDTGMRNFTSSSPEPLNADPEPDAIADPDSSNPNVNPTSNPNPSANPDNNDNERTDQPSPENASRCPTRSPSLSLNIFHLGALTQRQHATLLNELHYVPDIRPGEPFPMEYEGLLRGLWWGWEGRVEGGNVGNVGGVGVGGRVGEDGILREPGVGQHLDRIQSETGIALPDNLTYFFASPEKLSEWFGDDYVPSDEDVLRCRGRTTGIQETVFTLGKSGLGKAVRERRKVVEARRAGVGGFHGEGRTHHDETGTGTGTGTGTTATTASGTTSGSGGAGQSYSHRHPPSPQFNAPLRLSMGKTRLHLVDVGGQRSERRKWMHCFQDVTAVLFLVGLSGYSQGMLEDPRSNQMMDAMALWDGVCSSEWFKQTSLILFLNKKDLFAAKMAKFPIKNYFPDYEGGDTDVAAGLDYFKRRFLRVYAKSTARKYKPGASAAAPFAPKDQGKGKGKEKAKESDKGKGKAKELVNKGKGKERERAPEKEKGKEKVKGKIQVPVMQRRAVYTHFTTATDTMQLRMVMVAVCDIILRDNLAAAHFL